MEEIPLPASPDSPGPPGEENFHKESIPTPGSIQTPFISSPIAESAGETYSPSMVTSSPEYAPGGDDNTNIKIGSRQHKDIKNVDSSSQYSYCSSRKISKTESEIKEPQLTRPPLPMSSKTSEMTSSKSQRIAKQRLKSFAATKGGTISFGINKVNKLNKGRKGSTFVGLQDDEEGNHYQSLDQSNSPNEASMRGKTRGTRAVLSSDDIYEKSPTSKQHESSNKKGTVTRGKEQNKMNIDSIIEEENRQKALNERTSGIPIVHPILELTTSAKIRSFMPGVLSAVRQAEAKLDFKHSPERSTTILSHEALDKPKVDHMGFVVNQRASLTKSKFGRDQDSETKSSRRSSTRRSRDRSPSRSHERRRDGELRPGIRTPEYKSRSRSPAASSKRNSKFTLPLNVSKMPASWKECKENLIEVCQIRDIKENLSKITGETSTPSTKDSLMIPVKIACSNSVSPTRNSNVLGLEGRDYFSFECEEAVKKLLATGSRSCSIDEYSKREFPKRSIKRTKVEPMIEWSFNPRHDSAAYLMSRNDVLSGAPAAEIQYLKAIIGDGSFPYNAANRIAEDRKLPGEENTVNWYAKADSFLNPQELHEALATKRKPKVQEHRPVIDINTSISKLEASENAEDCQMPSWFQKIAVNYKLPRSKGSSVTTKTSEEQQKEASSVVQQKDMEEKRQSLLVHQKDKKKKKKKNKERSPIVKDDDGDDLLSSLLGTRKKKKKEASEDTLEGCLASTKKQKKNKKEKKKKKSKSKGEYNTEDAFVDSVWEDPEKLVQLNEVVSMSSSVLRQRDGEEHGKRHSLFRSERSGSMDSPEYPMDTDSTRMRKRRTSGDSIAGSEIRRDRKRDGVRLQTSPSPSNSQLKDETENAGTKQDKRISSEPFDEARDVHNLNRNQPHDCSRKETVCESYRSGPRTPPPPGTSSRQRTGPRTPSPPHSKPSQEHSPRQKYVGRRSLTPEQRSRAKRTGEPDYRKITSERSSIGWRPPSPTCGPSGIEQRTSENRRRTSAPRRSKTPDSGRLKQNDSMLRASHPMDYHHISSASPYKPEDRSNRYSEGSNAQVHHHQSRSPASPSKGRNYDADKSLRRREGSKSPTPVKHQGTGTSQLEREPRNQADRIDYEDQYYRTRGSRRSRSPQPSQEHSRHVYGRRGYTQRSSREYSWSPHREYQGIRPLSPGRRTPEYRRGGRRRSPSPPGPSRRSPEMRLGRSPIYMRPRSRERGRASMSPHRRSYGSPYYRGRRTPSPNFHRHLAYESPPREHRPIDYVRPQLGNSSYGTVNQQQPDSTINDAELVALGYNQHHGLATHPGSATLQHGNIEVHRTGYYAGRSLPTSVNRADYSSSGPPLLDHQNRLASIGHPLFDTHGFPVAGVENLNSPKRVSLDERLEKELGIKVREGSANPDYSRPPPGYLPTGQRLGPVGALQSSSVSAGSQNEPSGSSHHPVELPKPHHQAHLSATEELPCDQSASVGRDHNHLGTSLCSTNVSVPVGMPTQLGVVPQYPPRQVEVNTISDANAVVPMKNISTADVPEEGRLVRVGNMLQIVPERSVDQPANNRSALTPSADQVPLECVYHHPKHVTGQNAEEVRTKELLLKVEEMGRKKDAERRRRREQRMAERMQQTHSRQDQPTIVERPDVEREKEFVDETSSNTRNAKVTSSRRILEAIEKTEENGQRITSSKETASAAAEAAREAKVLADAIGSVPETDIEGGFRNSLPDPQSLNTRSMSEIQSIIAAAANRNSGVQDAMANAKSKKRTKNRAEVRYISLKPLDKREKKRQQKIEAMRRMVKVAASQVGGCGDNEVIGLTENEDISSNFEEEFIPRSPVPLPDASHCKPILVQLGFSLSKKEKKVLRYADGVLPGQGSPDHTDESSPAITSAVGSVGNISSRLSTKRPKRRKRIRIQIIEQRSASDNEDDEIPPPPPGSPPLLNMKEFLAQFAKLKPLPVQMVGVN